MDYEQISERRDMSSTRKRVAYSHEDVISKIDNISLKIELDRLSDRLVGRIEKWKNQRQFEA